MKITNANLTQADIKKQLHYDPLTGIITRVESTARRVRVGDVAGWVENSGYIRIAISGSRVQAHRIAWIYMTGSWPKDKVDHVNGDRSDNRFSNPREATDEVNQRNAAIRSNNTSGIMGVTLRPESGKWMVRINTNKARLCLGTFSDFFDACCARKSAEVKNGYHYNHGRVR